MQPELVVTAGKVAEKLIDAVQKLGWLPCNRISLLHPSLTNLSRMSGAFNEEDLLARYPAVRAALERFPDWADWSYRKNKIFFACHAVSIAHKPQ